MSSPPRVRGSHVVAGLNEAGGNKDILVWSCVKDPADTRRRRLRGSQTSPANQFNVLFSHRVLIVGASFLLLGPSSSVSFILRLIYSFKQQRPHSKTMARQLRVELTSIIMQIWGKKSPIVTHSSKFLPPPVLDIQVNKLSEQIQTLLFRIHLE